MEIEEGGEGNRYNFPSQRKFDVNEIEPALRRQKTKKCNCFFPVLFTAIVLCSISYVVVSAKVDEQKVRADKAIQEDSNFYYGFCNQAKADHVASGTKESEALQELCGTN